MALVAVGKAARKIGCFINVRHFFNVLQVVKPEVVLYFASLEDIIYCNPVQSYR